MAVISRLPGPVEQHWEWQLRGSCRGLDSSLFFHPEYERGPARHAREERAKAICHNCPVLTDCRKHALSVQEPYGVWGAMTADERRKAAARAVPVS
jgi:WhiB family redox-sensing transcriptional regulator